MKKCLFCAELISIEVEICPYCNEFQGKKGQHKARKKSLGTAIALIILFGPFGFIYLGWKSFFVAIVGVIIIGIAVANQSEVVLFTSLVIFEILLLIIIWAQYKGEIKPVSVADATDYGNTLSQIEKLAEMKSKGILTEEEFQLQKSKLLSS